MLQAAPPLANETIEDAAIALLEAESIDGVTAILLETCLARAKTSRGAVFLGSYYSMTPARIEGGSRLTALDHDEFRSLARRGAGQGGGFSAARSLFGGV